MSSLPSTATKQMQRRDWSQKGQQATSAKRRGMAWGDHSRPAIRQCVGRIGDVGDDAPRLVTDPRQWTSAIAPTSEGRQLRRLAYYVTNARKRGHFDGMDVFAAPRMPLAFSYSSD
jgi:hypothetical protein